MLLQKLSDHVDELFLTTQLCHSNIVGVKIASVLMASSSGTAAVSFQHSWCKDGDCDHGIFFWKCSCVISTFSQVSLLVSVLSRALASPAS